MSPEARLSISTLAGLVNRGPAKIYLLENGDDQFWLKEIDQSLPRTNVPIADSDLLDHLLRAYRDHIKGLVIYDPNLSDTINIATTIAGLRDGLTVSPAQASKLQEEPYRLPVLADLRVYGWKTPLQAYAWAYKQLLPECSADFVAGLDPGIRDSLRSFLVAHRVFTCWLDARKILPFPSLGWLCERGLLKRILSSFQPGSVHLGWFVNEPFGIRLTSPAALLTLASDHCTNLEVWSSLPAPAASAPGVSSSVLDHPQQEQNLLRGQDEKNTTYLSFTISDGDNLQYCQHHLLRLWNDPARGSLPLGWTIAPALQQVMPSLAAFYRRTATENDEFIAGPSGAAYILPSRLPRARRDAFLRLTGEYMQSMHLDVLQVLDSNTWFSMKFLNRSLQKSFASQLTSHGLRGILSGNGSFCPSWQRSTGLPIYQNLGLALNPQCTLSLIKQAAARGTRYINVYIFAWKVTPSDLQGIVKQLGDDFVIVTPRRLLALIEQKT